MKEVIIKNYRITKLVNDAYSVFYKDKLFNNVFLTYEDAQRFVVAEVTKTNVLREIRDKYQLTGTVNIEYNGYGDSGEIESIDWHRDDLNGKKELQQEIEDWICEELCSKYAGWEINEGSSGNCKIDFDNCSYELNHGTNVTSIEWDNVEESF